MKIWIHRTLILFTLMATLALSSAAQGDPLPVPKGPGDILAPMPDLLLFSPPDGVVSGVNGSFTWSNELEADVYKLKLKVVETGMKLKLKATQLEHCQPYPGYCKMGNIETGVMAHVDDGYTIEWQVIGKTGDEKYKSATWSIVVDTVNAPDGLLPSDGGTFVPWNELMWNDNSRNETYKVVVKLAANGDLVHKQTVSHEDCAATCSISANFAEDLAIGTEVKWFVKAIGFNGDTAKSVKQTMKKSDMGVARID